MLHDLRFAICGTQTSSQLAGHTGISRDVRIIRIRNSHRTEQGSNVFIISTRHLLVSIHAYQAVNCDSALKSVYGAAPCTRGRPGGCKSTAHTMGNYGPVDTSRSKMLRSLRARGNKGCAVRVCAGYLDKDVGVAPLWATLDLQTRNWVCRNNCKEIMHLCTNENASLSLCTREM